MSSSCGGKKGTVLFVGAETLHATASWEGDLMKITSFFDAVGKIRPEPSREKYYTPPLMCPEAVFLTSEIGGRRGVGRNGVCWSRGICDVWELWKLFGNAVWSRTGSSTKQRQLYQGGWSWWNQLPWLKSSVAEFAGQFQTDPDLHNGNSRYIENPGPSSANSRVEQLFQLALAETTEIAPWASSQGLRTQRFNKQA